MIHPDIRSVHEDRFRHRFTAPANRRNFLGQSLLDLYLEKKEPAANLKREGVHFEIEIAMPGFLKEEIHVSVFDDILTVRGEKAKEESPSSEFIVQEFDTDILERQFKLAKDIGHEKISATYNNGILKLTFTDVFESEEDESFRRIEVV